MKDTTYADIYDSVVNNRQLEMDFEEEIDCFCGD